ncbi:MAG: hypothetical protein JWM59_2173 [Verrucomicrobiales bacterium]|nr:hypothetical protein [Verrucomicrobiales bacterium]
MILVCTSLILETDSLECSRVEAVKIISARTGESVGAEMVKRLTTQEYRSRLWVSGPCQCSCIREAITKEPLGDAAGSLSLKSGSASAGAGESARAQDGRALWRV